MPDMLRHVPITSLAPRTPHDLGIHVDIPVSCLGDQNPVPRPTLSADRLESTTPGFGRYARKRFHTARSRTHLRRFTDGSPLPPAKVPGPHPWCLTIPHSIVFINDETFRCCNAHLGTLLCVANAICHRRYLQGPICYRPFTPRL